MTRERMALTSFGAGERLLPGVRALVLCLAALASCGTMPVRAAPPAALEQLLDRRSDGERAVAAAEARVGARPGDAKALAGLASALLGRVRETYDPTLYTRAGELLDRATALAPRDADVAFVAGNLALSRHEFAAALQW